VKSNVKLRRTRSAGSHKNAPRRRTASAVIPVAVKSGEAPAKTPSIAAAEIPVQVETIFSSERETGKRHNRRRTKPQARVIPIALRARKKMHKASHRGVKRDARKPSETPISEFPVQERYRSASADPLRKTVNAAIDVEKNAFALAMELFRPVAKRLDPLLRFALQTFPMEEIGSDVVREIRSGAARARSELRAA
jgi:hypothetical protein